MHGSFLLRLKSYQKVLSNSFSGNLSFRQKEYLGRDDLISKDFSQMNFLYEKKAACEGVFKNNFLKYDV